jgi:hypothetical protein
VSARELRRFPDWPADQVVRFCAAPHHRHDDGLPMYGAQEIDALLRWARAARVSQLPVAMRNALLDLKSSLGGGIVPEAIPPAGR